MVMEGLDTLDAPSHHAYLLTESAASAHFNVLNFDTCFFKSSSTTSPLSPFLTSNIQHQFQFQPALMSGNSSNGLFSSDPFISNKNCNLIGDNLNSSVSKIENKNHNDSTSSSDGKSSNLSHAGSKREHTLFSMESIRCPDPILPSYTLARLSDTSRSDFRDNQMDELNTPCSTSRDDNAFFGPSTIIEPPPIDGTIY